jgi:hypothetical protein
VEPAAVFVPSQTAFPNVSFEDAVMFELARNAETLIDPINRTLQFQVNMFQASRYARIDIG